MAGFLSQISPWAWSVAGTAIHALLVVFVAHHCLKAPREPRSSLLWIAITCALPFLGFLLYLAFGVNRVPAKRWKKRRSDQNLRRALTRGQAPDDEALPIAYWQGLGRAPAPGPAEGLPRELNEILDRRNALNPLLGGNAIRSLSDGTGAYPAMLDAIEKARRHIHVQSYIIAPDRTGRRLMDSLARRAREGVRVRVLYDSYGSASARLRGFFRRYRGIPNLSAVGFTQANPLKRQFQINLRNHRKLLVVDGETAFVGGLNISDGNLGMGGRRGSIHDLHFVVRGPIVHELQYTFLRDWYYMTDENPEALLSRDSFPAAASTAAGSVAMRVLNAEPSAPDVLDDALFNLICGAREQIILVTPYFIPTDELRYALRSAALRGVDVRIMLPQKGNNALAHHAARSFFDDLLAAGARIFERRPPFMHTKLLVADGSVSVVGSANFDTRSIRLNYETCLLVFDAPFAQRMRVVVQEDFANAGEVLLAGWRKRPATRRLLENACALFTPVL